MKNRPIRVSQKEATVLWLLLYHADLSDQQIADLAGCSRTSLYRMPFFKTMRKLLRETGAALLPRNGLDYGYEPVRRDNETFFNDVLQ
jgi:hypothetical protein